MFTVPMTYPPITPELHKHIQMYTQYVLDKQAGHDPAYGRPEFMRYVWEFK